MTITKIEWASKVWNPLAGCSLASPGCTHCYAMKMAGRLEAMGMEQYQGTTQRTKAGFVWTGQVNAAPESILTAPLRQKKPTDYFVNSMSDLFHPAVPDALIDRVFAVMALCPQHVFKILTKRPDRMREYISDDRTQGRIARVIIDWLLDEVIAWDLMAWPVRSIGDIDEPTDLALKQWPLPNVWKGTSVEDQTRADERIPHLLATPAALRFLSMEPLLGDINIRPALRPAQPFAEADLPDRWDDFRWPEWMPDTVAARVMDFWSERYGRSPRRWLRDAITQGGPTLWSEASLRMLSQRGDPITGRFVHMWNNIGCVVRDGGEFALGSFSGSSVYTSVVNNGRGIDWVIVGGESGPGARPMHPDWARSLRDQCAHAGVPFFFKQWGDWVKHPTGQPVTIRQHHASIGYIDADTGERKRHPSRCTDETMRRIGKKAAGRLLDGREHSEFPSTSARGVGSAGEPA